MRYSEYIAIRKRYLAELRSLGVVQPSKQYPLRRNPNKDYEWRDQLQHMLDHVGGLEQYQEYQQQLRRQTE